MNLDHLVGCQESVADALFQGVGVHGLTEVGGVGDISRLLRRRGQTYLGRRVKVFQDLAPSRVVGCAAAVALVDHDQIEKSRRELAVDFWSSAGPVIAW